MANTLDNVGTALSLLKKIDKVNPDIALAIELLAKQLQGLYYQVNPPVGPEFTSQAATSGLAGTVQNFQATLSETNVRFNWDRLANASSYEIRVGSDWDTATLLLNTTAISANFSPVVLNLVYGDYTYLIKAIDSQGLYSATAASVSFTIAQIGIVSLTGQAIQNTALVDWDYPSTIFKIDYYVLYRDGVAVGRVGGTFATNSVLIAGTYAYSVVSVDIVGNMSSPSSEVELELLEPENYLLYDELDAGYAGTYDDAAAHTYLGVASVLGPITIESWEDHFNNNSWANIQAQISAGYPIYIQPSTTDGYYQEDFDLGAVLSNFTVIGRWSQIVFAGAVTITAQISYSTDGITYSAPATGANLYVASARYIRYRWIMTAATAAGVGVIYNLGIRINAQFTLDSGSADCLAADAGGTEVFYNKTFSEVNSVTATGVDTAAAIVVTDSIDGTSFLALVFDKDGNRIDATIDWKARGIV